MKTWIATLLNWFLPGAGYLVLGIRKLVSVFFILGLVGLTYVEFGIKAPEPELYTLMFASVLVLNTGFAIDAFKEGRKLEVA